MAVHTAARRSDDEGEQVVAVAEMLLRGRGDGRAATEVVELPPRVSVVIPTINEARNLPHVLERLPSWVNEVVVVDGHSTDDTVGVARRLRPDVKIVMQDGKGKGNALACGFDACTGDIIVTLDADGSTDPAEIPRFVAALRTGADFAKGTRFITGGGSDDLTRVRRAGNWALSKVVNRFFGVRFSDLCYGYNAFWRRNLRDIRYDGHGFEIETLLAVSAVHSGVAVVEVPSHERARIDGVSNLKAFRDGMRVLRTILSERIRPR